MAIAKAKDQLQLLLENAPIGIFSIQEDLLILDDYSLYLEEISGQTKLASKSFTDVFLNKSELNADERSKVALAIQYSFGCELMFWEANAENLPKALIIRENQNRRSLEIHWKPLLDEQKCVQAILITMRDVTETLKFRQQAIEGQNRLKYLGELIALGPDRFRSFEDIFDQHWDRIQTYFYELSTQSGDKTPFQKSLFQELHTLKASARLNQMSGMTHVVHEAEDFLVQKLQIRKQDLSVVADHLQAVVCCLDDYQKALKPLLAMQNSLTHKTVNEQGVPAQSLSLIRLIEELKPQFAEAAKFKGRKPCFINVEVPEDFTLSSKLYSALHSALLHMVSNSLDHGLESSEVRKKKGKTDAGTLTFFFDSEDRLGFKDDGQGICLEKVAKKAQEKGLSYTNTQELLNLLFSYGFSTRSEADLSSGRGVGLDAALSFLRESGSDLEIVPIREIDGYVEFYFAMKMTGT